MQQRIFPSAPRRFSPLAPAFRHDSTRLHYCTHSTSPPTRKWRTRDWKTKKAQRTVARIEIKEASIKLKKNNNNNYYKKQRDTVAKVPVSDVVKGLLASRVRLGVLSTTLLGLSLPFLSLSPLQRHKTERKRRKERTRTLKRDEEARACAGVAREGEKTRGEKNSRGKRRRYMR